MNSYPKIYYPKTQLVSKEIIELENYKIGYTENFFEYKLEKYFKDHFKKNMILKDNRQFPYYPDYIVFYTKYDLYVDVEIDEPYSFQGKMPLHYDDTKRDDYFLSKGWSIIRFAEEQICKYPELCCKIISEHIRNLTGESIWLDGLNHLNDIPQLDAWTKDIAESMATDSYRSDYLRFLKKIVKEKPQISILADGIFLNNQIKNTKKVYNIIWPQKQFFKYAKISLFVEKLAEYFPYFAIAKDETSKIHVEAVIFISTYHSIYDFAFDNDIFIINNYVINVYFVRTDDIICFRIDECAKQENRNNILLIADDPSYKGIIKEWNSKNLIIVRRDNNSTSMPLNLKYFDVDFPIGKAIGLIDTEL